MKLISTKKSLLKITAIAQISAVKPAQATQFGENYLKKEDKALPNFNDSSKDNSDYVAILVVVGFILAGTTVSVIWKTIHRSKLPSKIAISQSREEDNLKRIEYNRGSRNKQIPPAINFQQGFSDRYFKLEDATAAIAELNNAIRVNPGDAYLYTERAHVRRKRLGDKHGAIEDYTKAINIYPNNALFYLWRSQLYHEIGDMLKAMTDYNMAIRLAPEDTMYHVSPTNLNIRQR